MDGTPHPGLIFLHSENADGCNALRARPSVSSRSENRVKAVTGCTNRSPIAADAIEDEVQEALAICGGDMEFRSESVFDEASMSQCNGGFLAWFKLLQIAHIAGSGPDNSTTLGVTAALSSLRMIHSSFRAETNHQLMT